MDAYIYMYMEKDTKYTMLLVIYCVITTPIAGYGLL